MTLTDSIKRDYEKWFTRDYQLIIYDLDTGEVRARSMDTTFVDDPVLAFNELMADWIVELIGTSTIYGFGTYQIIWCYERNKNEYEGGGTFVTISELVQFYHWWMDNKY